MTTLSYLNLMSASTIDMSDCAVEESISTSFNYESIDRMYTEKLYFTLAHL